MLYGEVCTDTVHCIGGSLEAVGDHKKKKMIFFSRCESHKEKNNLKFFSPCQNRENHKDFFPYSAVGSWHLLDLNRPTIIQS